ncbi:hypothetical protein [Priestia endophytica]|uniref:Uncharacterized protein n=1 Tax=Priestia endophytica DSM 13796 TaxID=1121089 RepID=A0A1I5YN23_9BACI|nr:hypothetical protein [Priestia endophytica]KYG33647.1 hypothetical protein AZF06_21235 [Priestia endophytica]SFQ45639.1 hypothetical protein SAMN02745910_01437 [Priestia endophytica DSM 13796]
MKKLKLITVCLVLIGIGSLSYYIFGQEHRYAKRYAHQLFDYPLPPKTKIMEQDFDHGVLYGGGPSGSGGYPTVAAYMKLSSELSEKEIFDYYHKKHFEIYFEGDETMEKDSKGRIWYEGKNAVKENLSIENNKGRPIKFIIQSKKEFSYPFFISF